MNCLSNGSSEAVVIWELGRIRGTGGEVSMMRTGKDGRFQWLEGWDLMMFSSIVDVDSTAVPTAQHSLAPYLLVHHQI